MSNLKGILGDGGFDPSQVEDAESFKPMPPGWYTAIVIRADVIPTKAGDGERLKADLEILDEAHARRRVFCGFNIKNPSPKAQEIGLRELAEFSRACCGPIIVEDSSEFVDKTLMVKLKIVADKGYEPGNEAIGFKPCGGAAPATRAVSPARTAPKFATPPARTSAPAAKAGGAYPWEKKAPVAPPVAAPDVGDGTDDETLPF